MKTYASLCSLTSLLVVAACSGTNTEKIIIQGPSSTGGTSSALGTDAVCVPNATIPCLGQNQCIGAQTCNATGTALTACTCGTNPATGGLGGVGGTSAVGNGGTSSIGTTSVSNTGGANAATGGVSGTGGSTSTCITGPGPSNACWYEPWANGSCTASIVSASTTDIAASFSDESSYCNAGVGFAGANKSTLNFSAYSYISVSAQAGSGSYFNVQLTDAGGNYCYWSFVGNGSTKTYLVDLSSPTYCGSLTIAKALISNIDFTTNYDYTGNFTMHIFGVTFM